MRLIFTSALYTRNYGIIVIFTDPGLGSEKIMSQFDLWPIQVWHFILWSLYLLFLFRIIFCIITLVNKWHLFMGVTHKPIPITATFKSVYAQGQMDCFSLETAETPLREFGDTGHPRMRSTDGGTILTQNPQKQKFLIGFSKSYYGNYALGCERHKQNSIHHHCTWGKASISLSRDTHCTPAQIHRTIAAAF